MSDQKHEQLTGRASIYAGTHVDGELQQTPSQKAAAGPQAATEDVSMEVLRDGAFGGESYHVGDSIHVPSQYVEVLTLSGFAARSDRAEVAQQARDAKAKDDADAAEKATARGKRSTAVRAISTSDVPGAEPPREN